MRRQPTDRMLRPTGFTLVEMLVALLVLALLGLMSWRGLDGMVRAQHSTQSRADDVQALQTGLAQWNADLDAMVDAPNPHPIDWTGNTLRLTRRGSQGGGDGLRVVAWSVRASGDRNHWARWQSPLVHTAQGQAANGGEGGTGDSYGIGIGVGTETLVTPLTGWQLVYFRGNSWTNALSSGDAASTPPDAVRLLLDLAPGGALAGRITRDWMRPTLAGNKS